MRVQCPHCKKFVTLPNDKAELAVVCPECSQIFTAPALMNALPDEPVPPPPAPPVRQYTPPVATPPPPVTTSPASSTISSQEPLFRLTLSSKFIHWIGPIALALLFILSFFTWISAAPGGNPVYTQSAWGVLGGAFSTDITGEKVLSREADLKDRSSVSVSMVIALLLLIPTLLIGLGSFLDKYHKVAIPDIVSQVWPKRMPVLAGASLLIFLLLSLQLIFGMGLETAAKTMAENRYPVAAETETSEAIMRRGLERSVEVSRLGLRRTGWLWIAYLCSAAAAVGFALELALEHRGNRPDPTIEFKW